MLFNAVCAKLILPHRVDLAYYLTWYMARHGTVPHIGCGCQVWETVSPLLDEEKDADALAWLRHNTAPFMGGQ